MILSNKDIKNHQIIEDGEKENYKSSSYDLRIGQIINADGQKVLHGDVDSFVLNAQGFVYVVSQEKIDLRNKNITGIATIRTSDASRGILATNIGLVDPGYHGPLSSILINFGKDSVVIGKGDIFLRVTFHQNTEQKKILDVKSFPDEESYIRNIQDKASSYMGADFLGLGNMEGRINQTIRQDVFPELRGRMLAVAGLILTLILAVPPVVESLYDKLSQKDEVSTQDIEALENKIERLENHIYILNNEKRVEVEVDGTLKIDTTK